MNLARDVIFAGALYLAANFAGTEFIETAVVQSGPEMAFEGVLMVPPIEEDGKALIMLCDGPIELGG